MSLTDRYCQGAKCTDGKRTDHADGKTRGLALRVTPAGAKSWSLRYSRQSDGKRRRITIGDYPAISLHEARALGAEILAKVARGEDPAKDTKRPSGTKPRTFGELVERYLVGHAAHKRSGAEDERILRKDVLPALEGEPLASVTRADIAAILDDIVARGSPVQANRCFSAIRKVMNWAIEKGFADTTPIVRMKPPAKETSRDRVLTPEEVRIFWRRIVAKTAMDFEMRTLLKLCLVTGQRISEIAGATRAELHFGKAEWHIGRERTKNGLPHIVPLSALALRLFERAAARSGHDEFVLPSRSTGRPMLKSAPSRAMRRAGSVLGFAPPVTPHDLRRTLASGLGEMGYPRTIQDKVLNHITGDRGISGVYDRYAYLREKREALDAWADQLTAAVTKRDGKAAAIIKRPAPPARSSTPTSPWARR